MAEPGEGAPPITPRFVRRVRRPDVHPFGDDRGVDGVNLDRKINTSAPMSPYSAKLAALEEKARAQQKLVSNRKGTGQVNIEQPTTGGKVEPDERDGTRQ